VIEPWLQLRHSLFGLACWLFGALALAGEPCRIAFDMGSSGIRFGATASSVTAQVDIDYLGTLWASGSLGETVGSTIAALRDLPEQAGFRGNCERVGGGFSVWRLALQQGADELVAILSHIHSASGVAILVIPQLQEGAYGYFGARQMLGDRLTTSHVLDIGGGSLQISGVQSSYGEMLGQKIWHRELCRKIRKSDSIPCALQPMTSEELSIARAMLAKKLAGVVEVLPETVTMTAISRPVSRGVLPANGQLVPESACQSGLQHLTVSLAIEQVAGLTLEETIARIGGTSRHIAYLLSDMLLVEGIMLATRNESMQVSEIDPTNLPGLLSDDHAFVWSQHYSCYLERLKRLGIEAYSSDPATCP
jgi:hypothetical protein